MVDDRTRLAYIEFYITNVCNFNCPGCNRFNNYAFTGSSRWKDYKDTYKKWSERLTFKSATVLGGEPMICPDYRDWLLGIASLWPEAHIKLLTNGSLLRDSDVALYDILKSNKRITLSIGLHNKHRIDQMMQVLNRWLHGPVTIDRVPKDISQIEGAVEAWNRSWANIKGPDWPETCDIHQWHELPEYIQKECHDVHKFSPEIFLNSIQSYKLKDFNDVEVKVSWENFFHQGALLHDLKSNRFRLHNSDKEKAHATCHSKFCHHMERGKLYKCGQVSLFPQFHQQFHLDLNQEELEIISAYQPATPDMELQEWKKWVQDLDQPMSQCRFCPESYQMNEIFAGPKKIFVQKKVRSER